MFGKATKVNSDPFVLTELDYKMIADDPANEGDDISKAIDSLIDSRVSKTKVARTPTIKKHTSTEKSGFRRHPVIALAAIVGLSGAGYGIASVATSPNGTVLARQQFDDEHLSLPSQGGQLVLTPVDNTLIIPTVGNLSHKIAYGSPSWDVWNIDGHFDGDHGNIVNGSIRYLSALAITYPNGYNGLKAGDCASSYVNDDLEVKASSSDMDICNVSGANINQSGLEGIYVQFEYPH
jgi:hypothetical protein